MEPHGESVGGEDADYGELEVLLHALAGRDEAESAAYAPLDHADVFPVREAAVGDGAHLEEPPVAVVAAVGPIPDEAQVGEAVPSTPEPYGVGYGGPIDVFRYRDRGIIAFCDYGVKHYFEAVCGNLARRPRCMCTKAANPNAARREQ